ncbi:hypothetical protein BJY00DRAFT_284088 [Aspergillus carlsbadensis]|nr:hypothetical protein BJY00DRAFT_284088 [Aspergillus carlsbadensis]
MNSSVSAKQCTRLCCSWRADSLIRLPWFEPLKSKPRVLCSLGTFFEFIAAINIYSAQMYVVGRLSLPRTILHRLGC